MTVNGEVTNKKALALAKALDTPTVIVNSLYNDYGLGFAHQEALKFAHEIASEYTDAQKKKVYFDLLNIFQLWKDECGIFPPNGISRRLKFISILKGENLSDDTISLPAKEYDLQVIERQKQGEKIEVPAPWECCPYVSTPIGLFDKIWSDGFKPLDLYLRNNIDLFPLMRSTLIVLSNSITREHNLDCIKAAIHLGSVNSYFKQCKIRQMTPAAVKEFNRKRMQAEKQNIKTEQTKIKVLDCWKTLSQSGNPFNHKSIHAETGVSLSQISRILRDNGIKSKK